jgi:hypothetical protein
MEARSDSPVGRGDVKGELAASLPGLAGVHKGTLRLAKLDDVFTKGISGARGTHRGGFEWTPIIEKARDGAALFYDLPQWREVLPLSHDAKKRQNGGGGGVLQCYRATWVREVLIQLGDDRAQSQVRRWGKVSHGAPGGAIYRVGSPQGHQGASRTDFVTESMILFEFVVNLNRILFSVCFREKFSDEHEELVEQPQVRLAVHGEQGQLALGDGVWQGSGGARRDRDAEAGSGLGLRRRVRRGEAT